MDLRFSPEEEAFRLRVRKFIQDNLDPVTHRKLLEGKVPAKCEVVAWQRKLNENGWAVLSWPKEYGGPGFSPIEKMIFLDELHQAPAPEPVSFNAAMLGPVLIKFGTEAQKQRFLGPTANCDIWWCQGFSEPGAGSDLAALQTNAVRGVDAGGEHYIVNGHKIWQGMGQNADWMFALVRTDRHAPKRQQGISFLLLDMKTPGITVRPIITADLRHEVNEVFLDNVRVPAENLVGNENDGWTITKFLLSNERTNIARIGMTKSILRRAKALNNTELAFRKKAAAIEAELKILEITQLRILDGQRTNTAADPRSSVIKLKGVELRQAASELLVEHAGLKALRAADGDPDEAADPGATIFPNYAALRAASIYGGTSEVQKNIIAKNVLGL